MFSQSKLFHVVEKEIYNSNKKFDRILKNNKDLTEKITNNIELKTEQFNKNKEYRKKSFEFIRSK